MAAVLAKTANSAGIPDVMTRAEEAVKFSEGGGPGLPDRLHSAHPHGGLRLRRDATSRALTLTMLRLSERGLIEPKELAVKTESWR